MGNKQLLRLVRLYLMANRDMTEGAFVLSIVLAIVLSLLGISGLAFLG